MTTRALRRLAAAVALALVLAASAAAQDGGASASVSVRAVSNATADRITLGDIADVSSSDASLEARLRAISLGYAPGVGSTRELQHDRIVMLIAAAVPEGGVYVEGPEVAVVRRDAQSVDTDALRAAVEREALAGLSAAGATARLVKFEVQGRVDVPSGNVDVKANLSNVRDLLAPFSVPIEIRVDGQVVRRVNATAQVEAFAPVFVASRDISAQGRVRIEDAKIEVRRLERPMAAYLNDERQLRGVAASRPIRIGEPLMTDSVVGAIVVKQGDSVRISGESHGVSIAATGEARGAGRVGDRIAVKNTQSGTLLQAVVTGDGAVRVIF